LTSHLNTSPLTIRNLLSGGEENNALAAERIATIAAEVRDVATAEGILLSYLAHEPNVPDRRLASLLAIFEAAVEVGHNIWPRQVRELVVGKDILDLGCGNTFHGAVFRAMGAKSYLGIDQKVDLATRRFRSRRRKGSQKVRVSLAAVTAHISRIDYDRSENLTFSESFDVVLMHTVTEHLSDIERTFASLHKSLRPNGVLWFLHDNFYSWAGHHGQPSSLATLDPTNLEHLRLADWAHLVDQPDRDAGYWADKGLNRVRLDELRRVTDRHFTVAKWQEIPSSSKYRIRLTPEIREARGMGLSERELLTQHVVCLAEKSGFVSRLSDACTSTKD
jgi:SAM-dependent methyltransferase